MKEEQIKPPKLPKGGFREGAGRKKKFGVPTSLCHVRLRNDYLQIIDLRYKSRSDFIQKAVHEKLKKDGLIFPL